MSGWKKVDCSNGFCLIAHCLGEERSHKSLSGRFRKGFGRFRILPEAPMVWGTARPTAASLLSPLSSKTDECSLKSLGSGNVNSLAVCLSVLHCKMKLNK